MPKAGNWHSEKPRPGLMVMHKIMCSTQSLRGAQRRSNLWTHPVEIASLSLAMTGWGSVSTMSPYLVANHKPWAENPKPAKVAERLPALYAVSSPANTGYLNRNCPVLYANESVRLVDFAVVAHGFQPGAFLRAGPGAFFSYRATIRKCTCPVQTLIAQHWGEGRGPPSARQGTSPCTTRSLPGVEVLVPPPLTLDPEP